MKITVFHQHYLMPGQGGGSRFNEMARHWTDAGHSVLVVAGSVNCGFNSTRNTLFRREKDGKVDVWRCYVPGTYSKSYLGRAWAFLGYMVSASIAALFIPKPDVIIATAPPPIAVVAGWIAARFRRRNVPWIFEIRDLWPESAVTTGVLREKSPITRLLYKLERWACRSADCINVLTPAFREDLLRRNLAPDEKIVFVPNGADLDAFHPGLRDNSVRREFGWGSRKVVLYAGAHGRANALHQLIDAAERLKGRPDILISCIGDGPERETLVSDARARGLDNIQFQGPQPKERMPEFINACDIGIAVLQNNSTFRTVYPNKIFDYMACARPVLLAIDGVARQLVCDQARAGSFAEPENGAAIAREIETMLADPAACEQMGANGRAWVLANAARPALAARYLNVMLRLTNAASRESAAGSNMPAGKRLFDIAGACILLVVFLPVILAVAILIALTLGRPVLFRQARAGIGNSVFQFVKFRSMTSECGPDGRLLPDERRLTRFGRFLRSSSLDELPQLWNVLTGDMSLVGPRPLPDFYLPRYDDWQRRRHEVLPGITGWAQIHGRNSLSWQRKFECDIWYVDHRSFWLDLKILVKTAGNVIRREGISQKGHSTMPEFRGL